MAIRYMVRLRRGTTEQWANEGKDIVPLDGELVLENDNGVPRLKIGNGTDVYGALPYMSVDSFILPKQERVHLSTEWEIASDDRYFQEVIVEGAVITSKSKIDLQPNSEDLAIFHEKDLAFVAENTDGVVRVYCVGQVPQNEYDIPVTVTEIITDDDVIVGNTTATPNPYPDWNQTDPKKADYIKNKPIVDQTYRADSANAQSGTAVAQAIANIDITGEVEVIDEHITEVENNLNDHKGNKENPHNVTLAQLKYTNEEPLIKDVGGILASNHTAGFNNVPINDLITELLYPYTPAVINSFSLNPGAGAKEMNVPLTVNTATVKITKKSKTIESVALYRGTELLQTKTDSISSSGTTLTFTFDNEVLDGSTDTSYQVKVTESGGAVISSGKQTYDFVYPYFYGVVASGASIDSNTVLSFTKSIRAKGNHSYTYTTTDQCPVIAYPKSYGALKSIIDPNNFTQNWTQYTVTVNGVAYYAYVGGASTATAKYTFNY